MTALPSDAPLTRDEYIQRHLRFNLLAFITDGSGWWLGMSFLSAQTILPFFVKQLGGGEILIGAIPALFSLGYLLPQLFVAPWTERRPIQRRTVIRIAMLERLPFGVLGLLTLWLARPAPNVLLPLFFVCIAVNAFSMGVNMPGYATMLSKAVPPDKRGRMWGFSVAFGGIVGLVGASLSAWLLGRYGMPLGFALCFLAGFIVLVLTVLPLGIVREPEALDAPAHPSFRAYWCETRDMMRHLHGFQRLLMTEWLVSLASMAPAFYMVHAIGRFHAGAEAVGTFNGTVIAASVLGGFLWGAVSDRFGNRRTLACSIALMLAAPAAALAVPSLVWYPLVFFLSSLAGSGFDLGNFNILLEFGGERKVATFQGIRAIAVTPARVLSPLLGGYITAKLGFEAVFAVSAASAAGAALLLRRVPEPRHQGDLPGGPLRVMARTGEMEC